MITLHSVWLCCVIFTITRLANTIVYTFFSVFVTILVEFLSLEIILFKTTTLSFLAPCNHVFHSIKIYIKRVFIIQCYSFHNTLCRMTFMIRSSKLVRVIFRNVVIVFSPILSLNSSVMSPR